MLKVHTTDGQTCLIDLKDEAQAKEWLERFRSLEAQRQIAGLSVTKRCSGRFYCSECRETTRPKCAKCGSPVSQCSKGSQFSMSRPEDFDQIFYAAELVAPDQQKRIRGGEKITCFVDDIVVTMMIHADQPSTKVSLIKRGKQRYNPLAE